MLLESKAAGTCIGGACVEMNMMEGRKLNFGQFDPKAPINLEK
jgi:hypothetical protein